MEESYNESTIDLTGKVAVVTGAASRSGTAICRELVKNNAFVLGLDENSRPSDEDLHKEQLFALVQYESLASPTGAEVAGILKERFNADRIDWCINIVGEEAKIERRLQPTELIIAEMEKRQNGLVLNVVAGCVGKDAPQASDLIGQTDENFTNLKEAGVRCNLLVPYDLRGGNNEESWLEPRTRAAMQTYIQKLQNYREERGEWVDVQQNLASLALFLCSDMGKQINGAMVDTNGNCVAL